MTIHDVHVAHDEAVQSSFASLDVEETGLAHAVALDALIDANRAMADARRAVTRAGDVHRAALDAYAAALDARDAEMTP